MRSSLIRPRPPQRDQADGAAASREDQGYQNAIDDADRFLADLVADRPGVLAEITAFEDQVCITKIEPMLRQVRQPLGLVPLEFHPVPGARTDEAYVSPLMHAM